MSLIVDWLSIAGPHGPLLLPTDLDAPSAAVTLIAGDPGPSGTALALALGGRMRGCTGTIHLDGEASRSLLRTGVVLVDVPDVTEPDPSVSVRTVVGEELALIGAPASNADIRRFISGHTPAGTTPPPPDISAPEDEQDTAEAPDAAASSEESAESESSASPEDTAPSEGSASSDEQASQGPASAEKPTASQDPASAEEPKAAKSAASAAVSKLPLRRNRANRPKKELASRRWESLPPAVRIDWLMHFAERRAGARALILTHPDRWGGDPHDWYASARRAADNGLTIVVICTHASVRLLGEDVVHELGVCA